MWCGAARSVAPSCTTCATGAANPPASPSGPNGRRKPPKPRSNPRVPLALQGDPEEFADISGRHTTPEQGDCGCVESVAFLTAARVIAHGTTRPGRERRADVRSHQLARRDTRSTRFVADLRCPLLAV